MNVGENSYHFIKSVLSFEFAFPFRGWNLCLNDARNLLKKLNHRIWNWFSSKNRTFAYFIIQKSIHCISIESTSHIESNEQTNSKNVQTTQNAQNSNIMNVAIECSPNTWCCKMRTKQVCGKWTFSEIISTNWREYARQAVNRNNHGNKQYRNGFNSENDENFEKEEEDEALNA